MKLKSLYSGRKFPPWVKPGRVVWLVAILLLVGFCWVVPRPLLTVNYSTVIESEDGQLLGARIATDGQWRFPAPDSIPQKFVHCLLAFEDRYFFYHPGINPISLTRAAVQNVKARKIVSGGSTITMQLSRLARERKPRTAVNKLIEMVWSLNLELRFSKKEILKMYAGLAPFGGNVVGLEAAAWRYFQRPPHLLSWAETATLAVLPNAPSLIFPGKNDQLLLQKRNRLLKKLVRLEIIDSLTYELSAGEPLPGQVYRLPEFSYHLLGQAARLYSGKRIKTTVDFALQQKVAEAVNQQAKHLSANHIYNACAIVAEVKTGKVRAYVGNVSNLDDRQHNNHVDIIQAPRSSGSILKPFLYAALTDRGILAPKQLIADIPTRFGGFTPLNFDKQYDGAVPAAEALARSLNVPAVKMLQQLGVDGFYRFLQKAGMTTLSKQAEHYGLSLILGGAEITLWDIAGMYASMSRILTGYHDNDGFYAVKPFQTLHWQVGETLVTSGESAQPFLRAASVYQTYKALIEVHRPDEEAGWELFAGNHNIAWKTGTSFGFRDGWAVGTTCDYVVAVWTGNADGEGRPGLTGSACAAPLLFEIFGFLPQSRWFAEPSDEMTKMAFCRESGFLPSPNCYMLDTLLVPVGTQPGICNYHQLIYLDKTEKFSVNSNCYPVSEIKSVSWFILPPAMEYYYRQKHSGYKNLPPLMAGCQGNEIMMELIYPREMFRIFVPRQLDGQPGKALFEVAHRNPKAMVHWYIDKEFAGTTSSSFHQLSLNPPPGWHTLMLVDQDGNQLVKRFLVVDG